MAGLLVIIANTAEAAVDGRNGVTVGEIDDVAENGFRRGG
jgi:hypothetical protein